MRPKRTLLAALYTLPLFSCATEIDFVPLESIKLEQMVELNNMEDYENLVKRHRVKIVYYTGEFFVIELNSMLYLLRSRGYKSFHDYKEGKLAEPEEYTIFKPGYSLKRPREPERR